MATINSENNSLTGSTGSGSFVGNTSPTFSGTLDVSTTSFEIPNNTNPTISSTGQIALDTSISGFSPLIMYHNGVSQQAAVSALSSDLSTQNGYVIAYDSGASKFKMQQEIGGKGIVQYRLVTLGADSTTTSTSATAVGISDSITPTSSSNKIVCEFLGSASAARNTGSNLTRYGTLYLIVTVSGSPTTLAQFLFGRNLTSTDSANAPSYAPFSWYYEQIPGSTTARTYSLSFSVPSGVTSTVYSGTYLLIYEIEV